jgi:hypothetical protein
MQAYGCSDLVILGHRAEYPVGSMVAIVCNGFGVVFSKIGAFWILGPVTEYGDGAGCGAKCMASS